MEAVDGEVVFAAVTIIVISIIPLLFRRGRPVSGNNVLAGKKIIVFSSSRTMVVVLKETLCSGDLHCSFRDLDSFFAPDVSRLDAVLLVDAISVGEADRVAEFVVPGMNVVVLVPFWALKARRKLRIKGVIIEDRHKGSHSISRAISRSLAEHRPGRWS